ncbi:MAG: hypothetical protein ACREQV_09115 [Candidatus Binatia bacterium]
MAKIDVKRLKADASLFEVTVLDIDGSSSHRITVTPATCDSLGIASSRTEDLVRESFEFLLEREPRSSIMRDFELMVIARYFPEYRDQIVRRLDA